MIVKKEACRELGGDGDSKVLLVSVPSSGPWKRSAETKDGASKGRVLSARKAVRSEVGLRLCDEMRQLIGRAELSGVTLSSALPAEAPQTVYSQDRRSSGAGCNLT